MAQNQYTQDYYRTQYPSTSAPAPADPQDYYPSRGKAVRGYYQTYLGREADEDGYRGWVNGGMELPDVENAIKGSPEAQAYASRSTTPPPVAGQDWATGPWDANRVRAYFQSRGVTPNGTSPDYWAQKWQEFGQKDPAYFLQRLSTADEFGGGGGAMGGGGGANPAQPGGVSGFTSQIRNLIMQRIGNLNQPYNPDTDPVVSSSMAGANLENQRGQQDVRRVLAERLYASGDLDTQALEKGLIQSAERGAAGLSTLRGQLVQRQADAQRQELQGYMQQALASGDAETARQIQLYMANLDAALRREGYGINLAMFGQGQNAATVGAVA